MQRGLEQTEQLAQLALESKVRLDQQEVLALTEPREARELQEPLGLKVLLG